MRNFEDSSYRLRKKLTIVGDGAVGKTALLMVQGGEPFPEAYVPTIFENYVSKVTLANGKEVNLSLWDTAGQEDYDRLRPLSYPDTDVVLILFSVVSRETFTNIPEKWDPEIRHFLPLTPRILVGAKKDLRDSPAYLKQLEAANIKPITYEEGYQMSLKIGANKYFEASARTGENVKEVFQAAAKLAVKPKKRMKKCPLL